MRRVFSQRTAAELRAFLRAVVLHGTGNPTAQIPGYTTAGKTGTAQMVVDGALPRPGYYAASFIGMIPYEHPRYVIYVKVERPDRRRTTAASSRRRPLPRSRARRCCTRESCRVRLRAARHG